MPITTFWQNNKVKALAPMKKRSVTIAGHRTSLTLEEPFWLELKAVADRRGQSLNALVTAIDSERDLSVNLCSALRLFVLEQVRLSASQTTAD